MTTLGNCDASEIADATAAALRDGWMHTGDVGRMDAQGYIHILDRLEDMIITGGENVFSAEVEAVLALHPAVSLCAVVGLPEARWGERVHAVIAAKPDALVEPAEIIAHCRQSLAA